VENRERNSQEAKGGKDVKNPGRVSLMEFRTSFEKRHNKKRRAGMLLPKNWIFSVGPVEGMERDVEGTAC